MSPLVSIIIPAYNMSSWIGDTLRSVVSQTMTDWECIVVDDGSTDGTAECVLSVADPRIRVISQDNSGVSAARNKGIAAAAGEYAIFLDGDDLWHKRAVEWLTAPLLQDPECVLVWADFVRFEDKTGRELPLPGTRLYHTGNAWLDMLVDNFMQFGALCVRADAAKSVQFDTSLRIGEDRDWLLRIVKGRKTVHVPRLVHYYRQRPGSAMRDVQRFLDDEEHMLLPHLAACDIPEHIRRRALSSLAFHKAILMMKFPERRIEALAQCISAFRHAPLYCESYMRILRKLWFTIRPAGFVRLPKGR